MSAPNITVLYEFEANLEAAFNSALASVSPNIYITRDKRTKVSPRLEIKCLRGSDRRQFTLDNSGVQRSWQWNFTAEFLFVTDRQINDAVHDGYIANARATLENFSATVNGYLPYYWIWSLHEDNYAPRCEGDNDTDLSQLTYSGAFAIQQSAWPA